MRTAIPIFFAFCVLAFLPVSVSAEYLINETGVYQADSEGDKIDIENNPYACDPTYEGLMDFLKKNNIDERDYELPEYTCANFAEDLHNVAEKEFIRAGIVCVNNDDINFHHAFNRFDTVDKGPVFIDCTSGYDGKNDMGDCIVEFGENCAGYTIRSIENSEWTTTVELSGHTHFEYYW